MKCLENTLSTTVSMQPGQFVYDMLFIHTVICALTHVRFIWIIRLSSELSVCLRARWTCMHKCMHAHRHIIIHWIRRTVLPPSSTDILRVNGNVHIICSGAVSGWVWVLVCVLCGWCCVYCQSWCEFASRIKIDVGTLCIYWIHFKFHIHRDECLSKWYNNNWNVNVIFMRCVDVVRLRHIRDLTSTLVLQRACGTACAWWMFECTSRRTHHN